MTSPRTLVAAIAVLLFAAACGGDTDEIVADAGALGHIHDLVVTGDGELLVASHTGLYRIDDVDRAVLVGTEQHDLMSMSADADGLLASGHPDLRLEKYRVDDHPPHLGLARSSDMGITWNVEQDLLGTRDFHALVPTAIGIYAADAQGTIMLRHPDGVWSELGELTARDLAADPNDTNVLVATDYEGQLFESNDGAQTWQQLGAAPKLIEIEWPENDRLVGAAEDGTLWTTSSLTEPWTSIDTGLEEIETLHVDNGQWWLTVHGGAIYSSEDSGQTWTDVYQPPKR